MGEEYNQWVHSASHTAGTVDCETWDTDRVSKLDPHRGIAYLPTDQVSFLKGCTV